MHGSRVYLNTLVDELKKAGAVGAGSTSTPWTISCALEEASGTARLIDIPPVEPGLRASLRRARVSAELLPLHAELAAPARTGETAAAERRTLLEVSVGVGLAFLLGALDLPRAVALARDLTPSATRFGAYARRVSTPYARAIASHFAPENSTLKTAGSTAFGVSAKQSSAQQMT